MPIISKTSRFLLKAMLPISICCLTVPYASANIEVRFSEGAPKDKFSIYNTGRCALKNFTLTLDLSQSQGGLIFDTTGTGAGVEVFQPFAVTQGNFKLASSVSVQDGDSSLTLKVSKLPAKKSVAFTIDVDDTLTKSQLGNIRVSDSEIKGGIVTVTSSKGLIKNATFGNNSKAVIRLATCNFK